MHKRMKAGNQENVLRNAHITGSLHTDNNAKEERAPPATVTSDNISPSHFGQLDVSNNCNYGSVTKELEETLSRGKKFRDRLYSVSPSLCRSRPSPSGEDMFHHPVVWPKKLSPVLQNQPHFLSTTQDTIDMEIDCATNDDPRMENYKCLRKSFVEEIHGCGSKFVHDSFTYRRTPSCVPVIIIDSDEEDDKGLLNTGCVSASRPKAYDGEEGIGSDVPCYMDVVVSQDGTPSPVTQDFGSWHHNLEIDDPCTITKSLEEIYREDTHINNEKVNSSCNLPFKSDEKMEIDKILQSEANQQISNLKDALASASEDKLVMESDFGENVDKEEEGETHKYESVMEFKHDVNAGIIENSTMGSCLGFGSGPLSMESYCQDDPKKDGLSDIWSEMTVALEYSKDAVLEKMIASKGVQECEHSCLLKDDLGYVCRICGIIEKSIETIFDYQWIKSIRSTRTYVSGSRNEDKYPGRVTSFSGVDNEFGHNLADTEISVHPRHMKQMKPHQLEGFNFLLQNLVTDKPRGCIMAHAPGSGKTLMIISFIQSFLAKYPHARPLIILPKGILPTWKSEFQRWEVEEIPLLDFYSTKADNRSQQLGVLQNWEEHRSILFLGYKQFSSIVCGNTNSKTEVTCQEILLKVPSLLVLDEGHTPRNDNTDVLDSLAKVKTPCKIVLSGTLYQNHVKEVFNIFKLVCPKFLRLKTSQSVVKRIMSRVQISGGSRSFFDLVEETLQHHDDFKRKIAVIKDLREMTKDVLHYYKGDFLEELPGLVDFTVLLNLTSKQKEVVKSIKQLNKFKRNSMGSAVHMHPNLKEISEIVGDSMNDEKIDKIIKKMDVKDGVKTKFFLNILGLSESAGEKLLVFSQYLLPLKFLERLLVYLKDWSPDKEMFMIYGNSNAEYRELAVRQFNNSPHAKVFFGSIKACGEGISLVGASRILILDVHLNPSVTRQAIGRAFRPGQLKKVYVYRLLAADSPEEDDHNISFRKEVISKMWFEWSEVCSERFFEMAEVSVKSCEDLFLESPLVAEDIKLLYRR